MDKEKKHRVAQTVGLSLVPYLERMYRRQGDKTDYAHICHFEEGRNNNTEELLVKVEGHPGAVRIIVDVVDDDYWTATRAEYQKTMDEVDKDSSKGSVIVLLMQNLTGFGVN